MNLKSTIGGLAGAVVLTALNESIKRIDKDAPRLDLLGMNAVAKLIKGAGLKKVVKGEKLEPVSMTGDLLTNSLYYGMADAGNDQQTYVRGTLLGLGAGLGALTLAKPLGLDEAAPYAPLKTKALTVAYYIIGGLVAATVINLLSNRESANEVENKNQPIDITQNGHHK
jgi:hypothetical protein